MQNNNIIPAILKYLPGFKLWLFVVCGLKWDCFCSDGTTLNAEHSRGIKLQMLDTRIRGLDIKMKEIAGLRLENMGNEN
jgi:hypothetical protein